jgi:ethanolamine utilization protein EutA
MAETLLSVGIDIGTSTTQLVLSRLTIENTASAYSVPRIEITDRSLVYQSEIYQTPLVHKEHGVEATQIDADAIRHIIEQEYKNAHITPKEIDTGAVIITGETARRENARDVLQAVSALAGDFVVATAGPDLESLIAAKGAGADKISKERRTSVVNIDIGGGTSNLAYFENGQLVSTGCLDVGGRLVMLDPVSGAVTYLSAKMQQVIAKSGLPVTIGQKPSEAALNALIDKMVHALMQSVALEEKDEYFPLFVTNQTIHIDKPPACLSFSGGVARCLYEPQSVSTEDAAKYSDIGIRLAEAIRRSPLMDACEVIKGTQTIRATVVGAGSHTMTLSGSTVSYRFDAFPLKSIPVLTLTEGAEEIEKGTNIEQIHTQIGWHREPDGSLPPLALSLHGKKNPTFEDIASYADFCLEAMQPLMRAGHPLIVIVSCDMAKALGQSIAARLAKKQDAKEHAYICLDGIRLTGGDYIDIGKPVAGGAALPVVIKTIIMNE